MLDLALDNKVFVLSRLDAAIQELDILFSTDIGEMIGDTSYGTNWYQYLHTLTPMEDTIKSYVDSVIRNNTFYCKNLEVETKVVFVPGEVSCSYIVGIEITDPDIPEDAPTKKINKVYHIQ